jgi:8-oxo-dGTP pyrophosphatase MutT (NUDIX family)
MIELPVVGIERLELGFEPRPWPFAEARRADIDVHFADLRRAKPALWNGQVLLLGRHEVAGGVLRGSFFETDFASFIAWRDWGLPDAAAINCFALGALQAADGAYLLGVMGAHTVNAGRIYFPAGTPDPDDIVGDAVDLDANVWRELEEETGLRPDDVSPEPGWRAVLAGPRIALLKTLRARDSAERVRARIRDWLSRQAEPELGDVHVARGPADLRPAMPEFIRASLLHAWAGGG